MATTVRRRVVFVKKTKKPKAPLPQRRTSSSESKSESAFAPVPIRPKTAWDKYGKPALALVGLAGVGVLGGVLFSYSPSPRSYDRVEAVKAVDQARPVVAIPGMDTAQPALPTVLSERTTPTDDSFRASSYTRLK